MRRVMLFDRYDAPIGELSQDDVFGLVRREEINGEHALEITTTRVLEQGWRVLTQDGTGKWREHVVYGTDALHDSGDRPIGTYYCTWSLQHDLMGTRVSRMPGTTTPVAAAVALEAALDGTARWQVGTVTNTATGGASMHDMSGWSAIGTVVSTWGGELDATIEVGSSGILSRKADLYAKQGNQSPKRRYDFGADLKSIRRKLPDGPMYCRITPRGKGEETASGGYGRKITIESVNGGKDYLENGDMVDAAKLPDGNGGWEYPTIEVENPDCETPAELLEWSRSVVDEYTVPKVTYEIDVMQLSAEGVDMHGVALGDAVHAVDRRFGSGVRVSARATAQTVNMLDESDVKLTLGHIDGGLAGMLGDLGGRVSALMSTVQTMNGGTLSTAEYLTRLLERLNAEINATGGYTYVTEGEGIKTYDRAVSDPLVGAEADAVVEIKGGTIRIANSRTAQGEWDWRTVFTSGHLAADVVTAAQLTSGYIGSPSGNYWNLDTGELRMASAGTMVGNQTLEQYVQSHSDVTLDQQSVFNALTDNGRLPGVFMQNGQLYVNANYLKTGIITDNVGNNYWNLSTGEFRLSPAALDVDDTITAVDVEYGVSSASGTAPTSWGTTATAWKKGKFLWSRQKMTTKGGTVQYSQPRLLSNGNGLGASSVTEQYYLSTSSTAQTGGSWSGKQQEFVDGRFYWTRSRIEWSDGTVSYTEPTLAQALTGGNQASKSLDKKLTQAEIFNRLTNNGAKQGVYLKDKKLYINGEYIATGVITDKKKKNYWNLDTGEFRLQGLADLEKSVAKKQSTVTNLLDGTDKWTGWSKAGGFSVSGNEARCTAPSTVTWGRYMQSPLQKEVPYGTIRNQEIVVSFDVKCSAAWGKVTSENCVAFSLRLKNASNTSLKWRTYNMPDQPTTSWKRVSMIVDVKDAIFTGGTSTAALTSMYVGLGIYNRSRKALQIRHVKLAIGNADSGWSDSPYDSQKDATTKANKALKDAKTYTASSVKSTKTAAVAESKRYTDAVKAKSTQFTKDQVNDLKNSLTQAEILKRLTNNDRNQGIYLSNRKLYINGTYIKSGTVDAKVMRSGVIVPRTTSKGNFNINLDTGYIKARNMNLENMSATGVLEAKSGGLAMQLANGRLSGYRNNRLVGYINPNGQVYDIDERRTYDGLQIQSNGIVRISSPKLAVLNSSNTNATTTNAFTGTVTLNDVVFNMNSGMTSCSWGDIELKFINGILVNATGPSGLVSKRRG